VLTSSNWSVLPSKSLTSSSPWGIPRFERKPPTVSFIVTMALKEMAFAVALQKKKKKGLLHILS
jgi:hypothetical protein